jgi:hypothetical protein
MAQTLSSTIAAIHEDLADELALLDNENTIFSSTVQSGGQAENSTYSRVADKHLTGRLGAVAEGAAVTRANVTNQFLNRKKISGAVQQKRENYGVSKRVEKVENTAGVANEVGEARYRALERYKQGVELTYLSQQVAADDASFYNEEDTLATGYLTMGASAYVESGAQKTADTTFQVDALYRPAAAQLINVANAAAFTETNMRTLLLETRKAKRKNVKLSMFATTDFANHLATFFDAGSTADSKTPIRRYNQDSSNNEITSMLTGYKTAMGSLMVIPTELLNASRNAGSLAGAATTNTSTTVTVTSTAGLQSGMKLAGTGIPAGAYIASVTNSTAFVISAAATATGSPTLTESDFDHALALEMEYFYEILNGLEEVDLSMDGSGNQGYVEGFFSLFCSMPAVHGKVYTAVA